jgi:GMP synthase-like glutamine amidotransferase
MKILAIQNDVTDPPHLVGEWLQEAGHEIVLLKAFAGEPVPSQVPKDIDALLPLGGSMGARDDHLAPWLVNERSLLADAVDKNIPIFAICLGAQLLAEACGGKVSRAPKGEIGLYSVEPTPSGVEDSIFNLSQSALVAQWHEDEVSQLPRGAVVLAKSDLCQNQVFRIGSKIYATQFHPEINGDTIAQWEADADNAFITSGKISVEAEIRAAEAELARIWKPVIQKWSDVASSI